jgi:hypothetical protein
MKWIERLYYLILATHHELNKWFKKFLKNNFLIQSNITDNTSTSKIGKDRADSSLVHSTNSWDSHITT